MKKILLVVIFTISIHASYWSIDSITSKGLSSEIICKNGYLVDIITGKLKGYEIRVEQSHCTQRSSWDGECKHLPIECK